MPSYHFVAAAPAAARTNSRPCVSIHDALRGANLLLRNGADTVWIVDGEGHLVLPAEQVKLRLQAAARSQTGLAT